MARYAWITGVGFLVVVSLWAFWPGTSQPGLAGRRIPSNQAYNPVAAGESLPDGFRQLLPRDAITPIYSPTFVTAADAGWSGESHVIGVEADGEAKAYPVSFLNSREMVIDEIGGDPILVSW